MKRHPLSYEVNARHDELPYQVSSRTTPKIYAKAYGEEVTFTFTEAVYPIGERGWWWR